ncbi:hypothetical protein D3C72_1534740 [compost metagenome]
MVISVKCRIGFTHVRSCSHTGMFSTGETYPESKIAGIIKTNTPINACCCVEQSAEINSPNPTSDSP